MSSPKTELVSTHDRTYCLARITYRHSVRPSVRLSRPGTD